MNLEKSVWKIILLALLLRLLIMPFLFHPDLKTHFYHFRFLEKGVINIYDYIDQNELNLSYKDTYNYPPLPYFVFGSYFALVHPLLGENFGQCMNDWGVSWYTNEQIFRILFILKIPYLIFDLLIGLLIYKLVEKQFKTRALLLWFFNPITLYIIYGMATFDVVVTFFVLLSLWLFKQNRIFWSGLSIGVGIAFKLFPVLFIPFFVIMLFREKFGFRKVGIFVAASAVLPLVTIVPFLNDVMGTQNSGLMAKFLDFKISILGVPVFFINYIGLLIIFTGLSFKRLIENCWQSINVFIVVLLLLMLGFTNYHPQWLIWVLPFLLLSVVNHGLKLLVFIPLLISYGLHIILLKDRFISNGILSPIFPLVYDLDSFDQTLFSRISEPTVKLIASGLFLIATVWLSITNLKLFKSKLSVPDKLFGVIGVILILIFFGALISLTTLYQSKKNLEAQQIENIQTAQLSKENPFQDTIKSPQAINLFYILIKNPNYRNHDKLTVDIVDSNQNVLTHFDLNGTNIGGEDWVKFKIDPIYPKTEYVDFLIHSETTDKSQTLELPLNQFGDLNYKIYSSTSVTNIIEKNLNFLITIIRYDTVFLISYCMIILVAIFGFVRLSLLKKNER